MSAKRRTATRNVAQAHDGVLFSLGQERGSDTCGSVGEPGGRHAEKGKCWVLSLLGGPEKSLVLRDGK